MTSPPPVLDELVPPPWSGSRRGTVALALALVVAVIAGLWWAGVLGPNIAPIRGYGYGALDGTVTTAPGGAAAGTVEVQLGLRNRGQLPVRDLTVEAPPFRGAHLEMPDGPVDIGPRHEAQVTVHLVIDDCSQLQAAPRPGLSYSASSGRVSASGKQLRVLGAEGSDVTAAWPGAPEPEVASWWYEVARPVCDPGALLAG